MVAAAVGADIGHSVIGYLQHLERTLDMLCPRLRPCTTTMKCDIQLAKAYSCSVDEVRKAADQVKSSLDETSRKCDVCEGPITGCFDSWKPEMADSRHILVDWVTDCAKHKTYPAGKCRVLCGKCSLLSDLGALGHLSAIAGDEAALCEVAAHHNRLNGTKGDISNVLATATALFVLRREIEPQVRAVKAKDMDTIPEVLFIKGPESKVLSKPRSKKSKHCKNSTA
ncbi:hypothetical protein Pmar_PMAR029103 [Perkinsus marinus ATCC 50983]|uniref:Uncharacterized protein n=1 Tax=Perkinsus marinus (strain ATCC 50983 / TXsc) TaxID=423536 RepID=C5M0M2_PERM5|nr:hypothetical protein Pmar_PMAR029103 [Perkinsus marinus ATCC 50983]EEQ97380.1 hypothetical protein Pmar_PMAR029103 [Perkinsus marinus ATCC 50983]|eukprot:XP_002764663.1 hypothetical protein Pmar_PMAR029103 [Perkinsus marinus ATCC 50983]